MVEQVILGDMSINRNGIAVFGNQTRGVLAGGFTTPTNTQTSLINLLILQT